MYALSLKKVLINSHFLHFRKSSLKALLPQHCSRNQSTHKHTWKIFFFFRFLWEMYKYHIHDSKNFSRYELVFRITLSLLTELKSLLSIRMPMYERNLALNGIFCDVDEKSHFSHFRKSSLKALLPRHCSWNQSMCKFTQNIFFFFSLFQRNALIWSFSRFTEFSVL